MNMASRRSGLINRECPTQHKRDQAMQAIGTLGGSAGRRATGAEGVAKPRVRGAQRPPSTPAAMPNGQTWKQSTYIGGVKHVSCWIACAWREGKIVLAI